MFRFRLSLLAATAIFPLLPPNSATKPPAGVVSEIGDHLFLQTPDLVEQLSDNGHYESVTLGDRRWYVLLKQDNDHAWLSLLECNANSERQRAMTVTDPRLGPATDIESARFLPNGRLFVLCHCDPTTEVAAEIDLSSETTTIQIGNSFIWDKSGRHVAYFRFNDDDASNELWIDDKKVRAVSTDDADLSWDSMGKTLSMTAPDGSETVLVSQIDAMP